MKEQSVEELRKGLSIWNICPREKYKQVDLENLLEKLQKIFPAWVKQI